jgi:hypothetical protein
VHVCVSVYVCPCECNLSVSILSIAVSQSSQNKEWVSTYVQCRRNASCLHGMMYSDTRTSRNVQWGSPGICFSETLSLFKQAEISIHATWSFLLKWTPWTLYALKWKNRLKCLIWIINEMASQLFITFSDIKYMLPLLTLRVKTYRERLFNTHPTRNIIFIFFSCQHTYL